MREIDPQVFERVKSPWDMHNKDTMAFSKALVFLLESVKGLEARLTSLLPPIEAEEAAVQDAKCEGESSETTARRRGRPRKESIPEA